MTSTGRIKALRSNAVCRGCLVLTIGLFMTVDLIMVGGCNKTTTPTSATTTTASSSSTSLIAPNTVTVLAIGQLQLYAYSTATSTDAVVAWTSSDSGILAIDNTGLATALSSGLATITGSLQDGTSSTLSVQVVPSYQGLWAGNATVIACTDLTGFTSAGYCAQVRGSVQQWSLTLIQTGLGLSGTMTKSEGSSVLSGSVTATIGGQGDIIALTGTLAGIANGVNLVVTPISWDSFSTGTTMTGSWAANVTSPQILGSATVQWTLAGSIQVPGSKSLRSRGR
jgi:hypothetical protein